MSSTGTFLRPGDLAPLAIGLLLGVAGTAIVRADHHAPPVAPADGAPAPPAGSPDVPDAPQPPATGTVDHRLHDLRNRVCPIMGGDVKDFQRSSIVYDGMLVHFCCLVCYEEFLEQPLTHLRRMKEELAIDVPADRLTEAAHPPIVWVHNERSPVSGAPASHEPGSEVIVVERGIAFFLASRAEIPGFLDARIETLRKLREMGHELPSERWER